MPLLNPVFDPNNFTNSTQIDNPYFPLIPGQTYVYESEDGSKVGYFAVTHETKEIEGVTCVVVEHTEYEDGELHEITKDYHAQDDSGNVWYLGEDVKVFEDGKVVANTGTWRAGVDGAEPGFFVLAPPNAVGNMYFQEMADNAQDFVEVVDLTADPEAVATANGAAIPYGVFNSAWEHKETTPLEPDALASKYYVSGVGQVLDINNAADVDPANNAEVLVKMIIDGTNKSETLMGRAGADEVNGMGGNDSLDGGLGPDTLEGGKGEDTAFGGSGDDAVSGGAGDDSLGGGSGNDQVDGGNGEDVLLGGATEEGEAGETDTFTGGKGADEFVFAFSATAGADAIGSSAANLIITDASTKDELVFDSGGNQLFDSRAELEALVNVSDDGQDVFVEFPHEGGGSVVITLEGLGAGAKVIDDLNDLKKLINLEFA